MAAFKKLSVNTLKKIRKEVAPEVPTMNQGQNRRRAEALSDSYNFVCLAAILLNQFSKMTNISIMQLRDMSHAEIEQHVDFKRRVDRRLLFNIDKSSTFLGDEVTVKGAASAGSGAMLKELSRNHTHTKEGTEDQRRAVGYTALTNSVGELFMYVTHLKDHSYNGTTTKNRPAILHRVGINLPLFCSEPDFHSPAYVSIYYVPIHRWLASPTSMCSPMALSTPARTSKRPT
jgi:hypothetical protein